MNLLQNMRTFVRVVDMGSFTAAADSLDSSAASTSRAVSELEQHLKVRLLTRSTRRIALTDAGRTYLGHCRLIVRAVDEAEHEVSEAGSLARGMLRVHSFASFGQHYLVPAIHAYRRLYPEVTIDLQLSQNLPDLFDGKCDTSILAVAGLPDSEIVMHRLGSSCSILCASPRYLNGRGTPLYPGDLIDHDCLALSRPTCSSSGWVLEKADSGKTENIEINSVFRINIAESLAAAIRAHMGIGPLPVYSALAGLRAGTLVRVLPEYTLDSKDICALFPSRRYVDARTRTWLDYMREYLPPALARDQAALASLGNPRGWLPARPELTPEQLDGTLAMRWQGREQTAF
ncbi:LysR family transcriptional regulator [Paraburkholderia youngii]|uniref:LysR family transcriptional regulator n=1 Tax=Paraburkholderia youngii TaxID=2782701 RepID=A0ABX2NVT8_9BURK|nr:LysR family transcriptional regulator [Paraburkholderia youngii]NVI08223.1 LysR family transcriptional regulator [Paraburkholderia youngii]